MALKDELHCDVYNCFNTTVTSNVNDSVRSSIRS